MTLRGTLNALKSSNFVSWKSTGELQKTIASFIEKTGKTLHSGTVTKVKLLPELAGHGRYFDCNSEGVIQASINFVEETPLCTTLCRDGFKIRTVEHLLSALEGTGVDNCRIMISDFDDRTAEIPILDGSAREWVEAIERVGLKVATDQDGNSCEKLVPVLNKPMHVCRNDSFIAAFPAEEVRISYGVSFPQVAAIGCQWFSSAPLDMSFYAKQIASARTFCIYEEVERLRDAGLIKGGSEENAIVCSVNKGWLNPPLRFHDEACRHKVLDLIGDLSLFGQYGCQGLPVAHILAYKGGHALHADFVRRLAGECLTTSACQNA